MSAPSLPSELFRALGARFLNEELEQLLGMHRRTIQRYKSGMYDSDPNVEKAQELWAIACNPRRGKRKK